MGATQLRKTSIIQRLKLNDKGEYEPTAVTVTFSPRAGAADEPVLLAEVAALAEQLDWTAEAVPF